jgi:hypothetical protein
MTSPLRVPLLLGLAALAVGPVHGQQASEAPAATPKSLLPDDDVPPPRPVVVAPLLLPSAEPAPDAGTTPSPVPGAPPLLGTAPPTDAAEAVTDPFATPATSREISVIGPLSTAAGGYGVGTFRGSRGRFLAGLANRIDAPIASRWGAITLRRALMSESAVPTDIAAGDWVAARTRALTRIGEIDGAKRLVDSVPVDRYTRALYRAAGQTALAAADVGGLCPIAGNGRLLSKDPLWELAVGMCAALQGDDITAAQLFDSLADNDTRVDAFDVRLGERVATIAGGAGRAAIIDWNEAPKLTPFRYAVASASGLNIPAETLAALGPARFGWIVRNPAIAPEIRLDALRQAAVIGAMSAGEVVSGVAALGSDDAADSRAGRLRTAFAGGSLANRRDALTAIWGSETGDARYGALIEAAPAAARLPIGADSAEASADIIAALLAAGDTRTALRWWPVADKASAAVRARAWALLATGTGGVPASADDFDDWRSATGADDRRAAMLLAGLAGLGVARGGGWDGEIEDLLPTTVNSWTRAIDAAAAGGRMGEVIILAATGVQGGWASVPPAHLYHIVAALTRVGRPLEARLIAAEAVTRSEAA